MRIVPVLLSVVSVGALSSCIAMAGDSAAPAPAKEGEKKANTAPKGAVLASDGLEILVLDLESGKWKELVPKIAGPEPPGYGLVYPEYSEKSKTLFYSFESRESGIMAWKSGEAKPKVIRSFDHGTRGTWLLLSKDESLLYFLDCPPGGKTLKLMSYELATGKMSVVSEKFPFTQQRPGWIDGTHLLTSRYEEDQSLKSDPDDMVRQVGSFDLKTEEFKPLGLFSHRGSPSLSSGGSRLAVQDAHGNLQVHELPGLQKIREIKNADMPEKYTSSQPAFVGEDYLILVRDSGPFTGVWVYLVNITNGETSFFGEVRAEGFSYLSRMLDWEPGK